MRKVLIILESEDLRVALRDALQDDYDVTICGDTVAGMALLCQSPDALVLDLLLPGTDGLTFLVNARNLRPPHTLMLTTFITSDILETLSGLGVDYVIRKPCSISTVVKRLTELIK